MTFDLQPESSEPRTAVRQRLEAPLPPTANSALTLHSQPSAPHQRQQLARGLGWFSVGLGLTELLMPRRLAQAIGVDATPSLLRALGLREIASGLGILAQQRPGPGALQLRVAGDAIDLGFLAAAWTSPRSDRPRLATATAAVLGVTALDVLAALQLSAAATAVDPLELSASIAIQRSPEALYTFWRNLENLPRVFSHVQSIEAREGGGYHIEGQGAFGHTLRWDVRVIDDVANERFAWETMPNSALNARGVVSFTPLPADRGTLLRVTLRFQPAAAPLLRPLARMLGELPKQRLTAELRRFKQWLETGEVATTHGQSTGRRSLLSRQLP